MSWNYRVIKRYFDESGITSFAIHEVYYGEDGGIEHWSVDPMEPNGESLAELKEDLQHFSEALGKPVLVEVVGDGKEKLFPDETPLDEYEQDLMAALDKIDVHALVGRKGSPFNVGGVKTDATTKDILDAVKESREKENNG